MRDVAQQVASGEESEGGIDSIINQSESPKVKRGSSTLHQLLKAASTVHPARRHGIICALH